MDSEELEAARPRRSVNRAGRYVGAVVGLAVVIASIFGIGSQLADRAAKTETVVEAAAASIEQGITKIALKLETVDGFFSASEDVSVDEFASFVSRLDPNAEAEVIAVALRVEHADIAAFRQQLEAMHPGVEFQHSVVDGAHSEVGHEHYYIAYEQLVKGFPSLLGYDLAADPDRYESIVVARALNATVVSDWVAKAADLSKVGFVIATPVHNADGERIGSALAGVGADSVLETWVPASVREEVDLTIVGIENDEVPAGSWLNPTATALVDLPGRSWVLAASNSAPVGGLIFRSALRLVAAIAIAYGAAVLTTEVMGRRRLQRRLVLIQSLAQERKRTISALADFELLALNSSDIITRLSPDVRYLYMSPSVEAILGFVPDEVMKNTIWMAIHRDDREAVQRSIASLAGGADRAEVEHRTRHAEGYWVWLHTTMRAVRDEAGNLTEIQTASRDVTERVLQTRALQEARVETERMAAEQARILATVSHEIRTPLTAVDGVSQLLAETDLDPEQRELVATIHSASESVVALVSDLLDISKADVGRLQIQSVPFDLSSSVADALRVLESQADQRSISLSMHIDDEIPSALIGDPHRLRQVLVNLVGNAIKFTHDGGVEVRVLLEQTAPDSARVRFEVEDSGIGIPSHRLDAVFEEFEQVDAATPSKFGGSGLGLGISRRLVHLMGGVIGVESEEGAGSLFWFELPFATAPEQDVPQRECLVVGRPANRTKYAAMLRAAGWQVTESDTSPLERSAVHLLIEAVDVIDADARLDGAVVLDLLPRRGNAERMRLAGARGYVGAPTTSTELDAVLTNARSEEFVTRYLVSGPSQALKILVADDAASNRLLVQRVLERRGHQVTTVVDGAAALTKVESQQFDVVLLDGHMPVMGGVEVTREIRRRDAIANTHTPIVFVSGRTSAAEQAEAIEAGADLCVAKPFDVRRLQDVAERLGLRSGEESVDSPEGITRGGGPDLVDAHALESQVGGLEGFAAELIESVVDEWRELAPRVGPEGIVQDLTSAGQTAHRLKGVLSTVGATAAYQAAVRLENACRKNRPVDAEMAATVLSELMEPTVQRLRDVVAGWTAAAS